MTSRNELPPSRYTQSQEMRQDALNIIIASPGISGSEIIRIVGGDGCTVNSRLKGMCDLGELKRKPVVITQRNVRGHVRKIKTYAYTALVEKTISAETVRRKAEDERKPMKPREKSAKPGTESGKTRTPGRYVQKGGNWAALKDQGGQGSGARRVCVGGAE